MLIALVLARSLNALALGDDSARALGAHVGRTRIGGAVAVTLLCGASTAAAGPMYFLGLTVPHAARALCGPDQRWVLAYSAVLGGALLLFADVIGRVIVRPGELQAGVMMAVDRHAAVHRARAPQADRAAVSARRLRSRTLVRSATRSRCASSTRLGRGRRRPARGRARAARSSRSAPASSRSRPATVISTLLGGGDAGSEFIINEVRLPRVLCALLVGAALGVSGAVFQSLTRNPLGSPDIVGFPQGATVGALIVITIIGGSALAVTVGRARGRRDRPRWPSTCWPSSAAARRATG